MLIIHPSPHSAIVSVPMSTTTNSAFPNGRHRGFLSIAERASRINLEARFSLALDLFQREHPDKFFVISPDPSETPIFDTRTFLSFRDRINLLRCGYVSAVQMIKNQFVRFAAALGRQGISISLSKIEERMSTRMEQLAISPPGTSHRSVERRVRPRSLVVGVQNVHT